MKKKLILIGICIIIIILIIAREMIEKGEKVPDNTSGEKVEEVETPKKYTLSNVWIIETSENKIEAYVNGEKKTYISQHKLSENVKQVVGDLFIEDEQVVKMNIKPEKISGKVLSMAENYVEIEHYGKLDLEKDIQIYKTYGTLSMGAAPEVLVGYDTSDFVVSEGKVCAVLIKEEAKAKNIRVLLKNNTKGTIFHNEVEITSDSNYTVYYGEKKKKYKAGEMIRIRPTNPLFKEGRIIVKADNNQKVTVLSLKRANGIPKYRGSVEVTKTEKGLTVTNELSLEEYLYSVIPSEMPVSYGLEALKVQAVCARSYAYTQLKNNSYREYGAHVDDSTTFQVYNNTGEAPDAVKSVNETYGQVIKYKEKVIPANYFSTSCGYTASAEDVWMSSEPVGYLVSSSQIIENSKNKGKTDLPDLQEEKNFAKFIKDNKTKTYDSDFAWYRWKTTISAAGLKKAIDSNLGKRYNANPKLIQTKQDGEYVSIPVDTVGTVEDIKVNKRGEGGIATEVVIKGSKNTVKVISEYNIRSVLMSSGIKIIRKDKSVVSGLSMLPSAFFIIEPTKKAGKLDSIVLTGGGYGHGVGMSQNGTKAMCDLGNTYDEVLKHYYKGIEIGYLYNEK